jgi:Cupredoxin-like domain
LYDLLANELRLQSQGFRQEYRALPTRILLLTAAMLAMAVPAFADAPIPMTLKNHRFTPATIHVKAGQPNVIALTNNDDTAEEFDSTALKVEKVVAGHSSGNVRLRPLSPGKYPFMGEYHSDTAQGVVIAE